MKILIVEDDRPLSDSLRALLEDRGYEVEAAYDGETGVRRALPGEHGLIILDVMLPVLDGWQAARRLRAVGCTVPILMLTARSELEDRVEGLNAGADYYLAKPFDTRELLACVNALLRRQGGQEDQLAFGGTVLDPASSTLACGERWVRLSARELGVMRCLMQAKGRSLTKETILNRVWGPGSNAVENHVEVYVGFLRKKLASVGSGVRIEAVRRLGYHLASAEGQPAASP